MPTCFKYPCLELQVELSGIAGDILAPGKGILSVDDTVALMGKRFSEIGIQNTKENRRQYRQLLLSSGRELRESISSVILCHESLSQKASDGTNFIRLLQDCGIIPGIKVDKGLVLMKTSENEYITQGLDDLSARCVQYKKDGCHFAKWRCCFKIDKNMPSYRAIVENASVVARYASICQTQNMVPLIHVEVLNGGEDDIERCQKVIQTILAAVYKALSDRHVFLEGTILECSMVNCGKMACKKLTPMDVALATVQTLRRTVPPAVPGIAFTSGTQSEEEATVNLNAINKLNMLKPWILTFSFGHSLQMSAMHAWRGREERTCRGQHQLLQRAKANSLACKGEYIAGSVVPFAGFISEE